jgi:hypothetical protein
MSEHGLEAPEADAIEQDAEVVADDPEADPGDADLADAEVPVDVDPADLAEQQRSVGLGDDEYR